MHAAPPGASGCRPRATCSAPTRTPPIRRRLCHGLSRGRRAREPRMLPDQPLIKDYNGPACAYVTGPFGGYTANNRGRALHRVRLLVGPDDAGVLARTAGRQRPGFLKLDHLREETISEIETILHTNERPSRGRFHERRGTDYRQRPVEMHISEIGFCSGHSASGVWVTSMPAPRFPASMRPATWRACRTTTCWAPS